MYKLLVSNRVISPRPHVLFYYTYSTCTVHVERYDSRTNQWRVIAPLSTAISRVQAAALGGYLYIAGGVIDPNNEFVSWLYRYSPTADTWQQVHYRLLQSTHSSHRALLAFNFI